MARQVLENGVILPAEYSDDWYDDMTSNLTKLDDVIGSDSEKLSSADVGAAALSNNYNDLDNLPTIPTVNDATLTIQKNGTTVNTFTANASSNVTANITVPTKTSDLTNDSNYVDTSNSAVASGITSAKVTSYDSHIADTDIHVTTADKNKWNNNTYVLRYSSASVTDNSTIAYSTLDNTDNIKSGDKVIDVDGKIFTVVSVDTANQTVTVGTALIDLALDSNVVHTSGNETIAGKKSFTDDLTASRNVTNGKISLQNLNYDPKTNGQSAIAITKSFSVNFLTSTSDLFGGISVYGANNRTLLRFSAWYYTDSQNIDNDSIEYNIYGDGTRSLKSRSNNNTLLGESSYKWKGVYATNYYYGSNNVEFSNKFVTTDTNQTISGNKTFSSINGVEPSSLSLPSDNSSNVVDISSYITYFDGTLNRYVPPANGWIGIYVNNCTELYMKIDNLWGKNVCRSDAGKLVLLMPVPKGKGVDIQIFATGTLRYARFVPCAGNV